MPEPGVPEEGIHANSYHGNNAKGANMTPEQLREAVARAIGTVYNDDAPAVDNPSIAAADAAIALMRPVIRAAALEEAARVVRRMPSPSSEWMADELLRALGGHANPIPAAIRALKEKPNG